MSDPKGQCSRPMGFTLLPAKPTGGAKKVMRKTECLGIELPWDWCLVKGERLRAMQKELREARFDAALRSRMCANLLKQLYRKESR